MWSEALEKRSRFVTSSYVLDEVATFFNSRGHHAKAVAIGEALLRSKYASLVHVDQSLFDDAWRLFTRRADKRYSLTDCVSFILMKRLRLKAALTFDKHFSQEGFDRLP